jgi:hypothetical protein
MLIKKIDDRMLYNRQLDQDTVFNSSMKRIAQYPESVGKKNQKLIDSIVLNDQENITGDLVRLVRQ